jgi:hypothetical protein
MFRTRVGRDKRHRATNARFGPLPATRSCDFRGPPMVLVYVTAMGVLMANARISLAAAASVLLTLYCTVPASAHGTKQVRRELTEQGFEQLEFQRTKPPFKLDACRDGQRYQLQVDYYGKLTEQTLLGPCNGEEAQAPADEAAVEAKPPDLPKPAPQATAPARSGNNTSPKPAARELCSRYFAEVGKTLQVPCE